MIDTDVIQRAEEAYRNLRLDALRSGVLRHVGADFFFPVITYPPLTQLPELSEEALYGARVRSDLPMAGYAHIPFCRTRCTFCHWVVKTGADDDEVMRYLDHLEREMELHKARLGVDRIPVSSMLIGGGTPSFLSPRHLARFMESIHRHYDMSRCQQFSFEPEPSTVVEPAGAERLRILMDAGVNRVSMGVQSFDDALLAQLGRNHDSATALAAIARMREAGIPSISIDLIYGLAEQSLESWAATMATAVRSGADAWQLYRLRILPHGDRPGKVVQQYKHAPSRFPGVDDVLIMKKLGIMVSTENGFPEQYTRIFARAPEHISYYLHDVNVKLRDVVGVGVSAWSNFGRAFALNIGNNLPLYHERIGAGRLPVDRGLVRTEDDEMRRAFILPLKNQRVCRADFEARIGTTVEAQLGAEITRLQALGLIDQDEAYVWLTRRGRFLADEICMQFFAPQHVPKRTLETVTPTS